MTSSSSPSPSSFFDSEQFKVSQRQSWDSSAPGWKEWWQTLEIAAQISKTARRNMGYSNRTNKKQLYYGRW